MFFLNLKNVSRRCLFNTSLNTRLQIAGFRNLSYKSQYQFSLDHPKDFWLKQSETIKWFEPPIRDNVLTVDKHGNAQWFSGATLNTSYLCLDRHCIEGFGDQVALIWDSSMSNSTKIFTYYELKDQVARFAGALADMGISKGDRVVIYMPMIWEALVAMLACARLGAVHSVVFGGFAAKELAVRIDDLKPKLIIGATYGLEINRIVPYKQLIDRALEIAAYKPLYTIMLVRKEGHNVECPMNPARDFVWSELVEKAQPADPVPVLSTDPLYILYTSGTTGSPKGIVRDNGGHAVSLSWSMSSVFDVAPGDVMWAASDIGWVVGHSFIVYGPLLNRTTTVMFEGKPVKAPDAGVFWRVIARHKVKSFFTAPTAIRAIKKEDPHGIFLKECDLSNLRRMYFAGERMDPSTQEWLRTMLPAVPVIDNWWQTETGWPIVANPVGIEELPVKFGSPTVPMPGYDVKVKSDNGDSLKPNQTGNVVIKLPLPPGCFSGIWNNPTLYHNKYTKDYPGYYLTGDFGMFDEDGYFFIMGRTDDVINCAGHRLSTGQMEEVLAEHPSVAECAVIGISEELKGEIPIGFVVLKHNAEIKGNRLEFELVNKIREAIGPVACFKTVLEVNQLPKTKSGKILRGLMRELAEGSETIKVPSTIDDIDVISELTGHIQARLDPLKP